MPNAVLVAEPEHETREYLGRQLRDDGFDVLDAARRSEALELAERVRPDVVLLAELDLCLRLRRGEPGRTWDRNVPVILLAPSSDPVERVRALDRGADDVIGRPFAYEELLAWFQADGAVDLADDLSEVALLERLGAIPGLRALAQVHLAPADEAELAAGMELVLEGLHQSALLAKAELVGGRHYRDMLAEMAQSLED